MTNVSTSMDIYFTSNGLMMLAFGSVIGAGFAALLYMITVLALPLSLDREVDFVSAMITSFQYVLTHPILMFGWALFIGCELAPTRPDTMASMSRPEPSPLSVMGPVMNCSY